MLSKEELIDWACTYARHKDVLQKKIVSLEKAQGIFDIRIKFADKEQFIIALPFIDDFGALLKKLEPEKAITVVLLNSRRNLEVVAENWSSLAALPKLNVLFVNPGSSKDTKWVICPYVHSRVADEKSLKTGLNSMFEMVDSVD